MAAAVLLQRCIDDHSRGAYWKIVLAMRCYSKSNHYQCARNTRRRSGVRRSGVDAEAHEAHAKVVILCASTIEFTRILLNSTSRHHPHGIGDSNGVLGKHLSEHTFGVGVIGQRKGASGPSSRIYIPNFRNISGGKGRFLRGYGIQGHINSVGAEITQCEFLCFGEVLPRRVQSCDIE